MKKKRYQFLIILSILIFSFKCKGDSDSLRTLSVYQSSDNKFLAIIERKNGYEDGFLHTFLQDSMSNYVRFESAFFVKGLEHGYAYKYHGYGKHKGKIQEVTFFNKGVEVFSTSFYPNGEIEMFNTTIISKTNCVLAYSCTGTLLKFDIFHNDTLSKVLVGDGKTFSGDYEYKCEER